MDDQRINRLSELFKALADPARLRILGTVAERPMSGRELSERLHLAPPTISHHMGRLVASGLVRVTVDAQRRMYALDEPALRTLSRSVLSDDAPAGNSVVELGPEEEMAAEEAEREKTLRDFFQEGRLKQIPAQRKKRVFVLQHLMARFAPDRDYREREVNDLLREAHEDVATLRRELVDYGFMTRHAGIYRVAAALPPRGPTVAQEIVEDEHAWLRALVAGATERAVRGNGAT